MDYNAHITRPEDQVNIKIPPLAYKDNRTEDEIEESNNKIQYLESLEVYFSLYIENFKFPVHPDGIHTYLKDSRKAKELVEADKELPQDLLDRLAYYKTIIDKALNEE